MRIQWGGLPGLKGIGRGEGWEVEEVRDGYQAGVDLIKLLWKAKKEKSVNCTRDLPLPRRHRIVPKIGLIYTVVFG